jgi:hypothetical protein
LYEVISALGIDSGRMKGYTEVMRQSKHGAKMPSAARKVGRHRGSSYEATVASSWGGFNLADLGLGIAVMTIVRSFSKAIWRES